jgi:hypothetical protein
VPVYLFICTVDRPRFAASPASGEISLIAPGHKKPGQSRVFQSHYRWSAKLLLVLLARLLIALLATLARLLRLLAGLLLAAALLPTLLAALILLAALVRIVH